MKRTKKTLDGQAKRTTKYYINIHEFGKKQITCESQGFKPTSLSDDNSECEPPDPIPNSEVKPLSANGSVAFAM